ncbi:LOW QUALITY PROTEIN: RNA-directed DNA methylation 4 [Durio zibethinus]|uniref:LOW QUALITY PROTEIN: RNA-directed DNA methylation 4 n=1 Tax=Durio zibethinus TaxID=66656 RepID=A0A6P5XUF7_DURZI|nr:LOW QUALITY PROTEIN: RNA-directed DNA methylation 4 [Durio zibethinus]
MASNGESSSGTFQSTADKPVIVRVKRKVSQAPLDAFWLEINERPLKRPFSDFQKLSISESSQKEELKSKKVFVRHVDTAISSEATVDFVQSFMVINMLPNSTDATNGAAKSQEGRHPHKTNNRQEQLSKSIQKQEAIAQNARFEQIWRSRKGKKEAVDEMCHFYDVVRVDVEESSNSIQVDEEISLADQKLLSSYLPLLREFIPTAAAEIESDMRAYMFEKDEYVYDYYTVKDDMDVDEDTASNLFPLVQVDDQDFYDVPYESEYDSEDSNAEDNPRNDYPDEISEEGEEEEDDDDDDEDEGVESKAADQSEEESNNSSEVGNVRCNGSVEDGDLLYEDEIYDAFYGDANHLDDGNSDDTQGEDWRWSYR